MASFATMQTERVKIDQIVSEFFAKSSHIILESRIPFISTQSQSCGSDDTPPLSASPSGSRPTNRWFNLEMDNCSAVQESVDPWRRGVVQEPMVVDVLLQQPMGGGVEAPSFSGAAGQRIMKGSSPSRGATFSGGSWSGHDAESSSLQGGVSRTLLERWVLQYERRKEVQQWRVRVGECQRRIWKEWLGAWKGSQWDARRGFSNCRGLARWKPWDCSGGGGKAGGGPPMPVPPTHVVERPVVYKRTVIMLRSLYCTVRTLPAHRLFRLANSSSHSRSFSLSYAVSATPTPLTDAEKAAMMTCDLTPVETLWGRLCISVAYRNTTAVTALEVMPPILPRIISDYVGSPTTDPLRRFSSVGSMPSGGISGRRGVHVVSLPGSVPSSPSAGFGRRHSWSGGGNKVQAPPSIPRSSPFFRSASPSPSQPSDFHSSPPKPPSLLPPSFFSICTCPFKSLSPELPCHSQLLISSTFFLPSDWECISTHYYS